MQRSASRHCAPSHHSTTPILQHPALSYPHIFFSEVLEAMHQLHGETRGGSAVNHAVIIGKANRQHQPGFDLAVADDSLHRPTAQAEDRYLRLVHDRSEMRAADAALVREGEGAALQFVR